jgi:hypothetical protein
VIVDVRRVGLRIDVESDLHGKRSYSRFAEAPNDLALSGGPHVAPDHIRWSPARPLQHLVGRLSQRNQRRPP